MPLKVKFKKQHLKWKVDDTAVLDNAQANYLQRVGVADILDGAATPEQIEKTLKKHLAPEKKVKDVVAKKGSNSRQKKAAK